MEPSAKKRKKNSLPEEINGVDISEEKPGKKRKLMVKDDRPGGGTACGYPLYYQCVVESTCKKGVLVKYPGVFVDVGTTPSAPAS